MTQMCRHAGSRLLWELQIATSSCPSPGTEGVRWEGEHRGGAGIAERPEKEGHLGRRALKGRG